MLAGQKEEAKRLMADVFDGFTTLTGRNAAMVSLRLLLVQESQRGYSPFSNTYCSPLHSGCSYPTHLRGGNMAVIYLHRKQSVAMPLPHL